jgi:predicted DsbA family dithiol-disulfide isomerase
LANQIGVRGVPFFVFDQRVAVPGAESVEVLLQAMAKAQAPVQQG